MNGKALSQRAFAKKVKGKRRFSVMPSRFIYFVSLPCFHIAKRDFLKTFPFTRWDSYPRWRARLAISTYSGQWKINSRREKFIIATSLMIMVKRTAMTTSYLPVAYQCLINAGLSHWIPPLMQLLHRYDGIERAMEPGQIPLDYLGDKLTSIAGGDTQDKERMLPP